ncbi:hypothetical protein [Allopontixanthobacter sediminis]|uniref:Uncharacterized protein n=1 Tax=Allopontixanthobacter sediminis TaxID=1689985 RepID=A0A845AXH3_9SPHN|nr:hypothetical protein [Allopontixanthobacter sediminis]MXP42950.1 hypothetical protein [Allopontixanthobacter sediminis]
MSVAAILALFTFDADLGPIPSLTTLIAALFALVAIAAVAVVIDSVIVGWLDYCEIIERNSK